MSIFKNLLTKSLDASCFIAISIALQVLFLAFAALTELSHASDAQADLKTKYFVANPKSLDYKFTGKKDEHRFGVELKENKQFHHTKTGSVVK